MYKEFYLLLLLMLLSISACNDSKDPTIDSNEEADQSNTQSEQRVLSGSHWSNGSMLSLAKASGCSHCHSTDKKVVGPSWLDVAERYRDSPSAWSLLIEKIKFGGSGQWGDIPMTPYSTKLGDDQIARLAGYILNLVEHSPQLMDTYSSADKNAVNAGESREYQFYANMDTSYTLELDSTSGDADIMLYLESSDGTRQLLSSSENRGGNDLITYSESTAGVHTVVVTGYQDSSYVLKISPTTNPHRHFSVSLPAQLRQLEGGEWSEFTLEMSSTGNDGIEKPISYGIMTVFWEKVTVSDPKTGENIPMLREWTSIGFQHLSQYSELYYVQTPAGDSDAGSLGLRIIQGRAPGELLWVEMSTGGQISNEVKVVSSPFETSASGIDLHDHAYEYDVIGECIGTGCVPLWRVNMTSNQLGSKKEQIETLFGKFDVYRVNLSGVFSPAAPVSLPVSPRLVCGMFWRNEMSMDGSYYDIHPNIGIVSTVSRCSGTDGSMVVTARLKDTSVPLPSGPE